MLGEGSHGKVNCKAISDQRSTSEGWAQTAHDANKKDSETTYHSQELDAFNYPECVIAWKEDDDAFDPRRISIHKEGSSIGVAMQAYVVAMGGWPTTVVGRNAKWLTKHPKKTGCT